MQYKLYPQCIDPNLLNVNEHIDSAHLASNCSASFDDVEIATGQAVFDDGDVHPKVGSWINSRHSHELAGDPEDVLEDFDYKYFHRQGLSSRGFQGLC